MVRLNFVKLFVVGFVISGLLGCVSSTPGPETPDLTFQAPLKVYRDNEIEFQLGIYNEGPEFFQGISTLMG